VTLSDLSGRDLCLAAMAEMVIVTAFDRASEIPPVRAAFIDTCEFFFSRVVFPWLICLSVLTVPTPRSLPQNDPSYDRSI